MFECLLWLHISPPLTPFLTSEMQNSRADSNQASKWGWLSLLREQRIPHKSCTQFSFFQIRQNAVNGGFWYPRNLPYHPTTSMAVVLQNSCHPSDIFVVPGLPLLTRSASSTDSLPSLHLQSTPHPLPTGYAIEILQHAAWMSHQTLLQTFPTFSQP